MSIVADVTSELARQARDGDKLLLEVVKALAMLRDGRVSTAEDILKAAIKRHPVKP